jgi:tetratricopeptide (TPR) repeat protein
MALAQRGARLEELHQLAQMIRFRYGLARPPLEEAQTLLRLGRVIWEGRGSLIQPLANPNETSVADRTRHDLLDLVVLWADLRVQLAAEGENTAARREALRILEEARALLGSSPSLERDRQAYAKALGVREHSDIQESRPSSAWEHFDLGKSYLRSGEIEAAARAFRAGLGLRPEDFWLNFYDGLCAYRLERFDDAVNAFRVAIALAPRSAECHYNRGLANQALGRLDLALADYGRALRIDDHFTDAALNRGMVHYRLGEHRGARTDLSMALATAPGRKKRGTIHYDLALVELAAGDRKAAESNLKAAIGLGNLDAQELSKRLGH